MKGEGKKMKIEKSAVFARLARDATSLLGIAASSRPYNALEMEKAHKAIAADANKRPGK